MALVYIIIHKNNMKVTFMKECGNMEKSKVKASITAKREIGILKENLSKINFVMGNNIGTRKGLLIFTKISKLSNNKKCDSF